MTLINSDGTDVLWLEPDDEGEREWLSSVPREWSALRVWNEWQARVSGRASLDDE